jgi:anti-sigma factor RsiW
MVEGMVTGTHPDDIVLFDYVEDDLPAAERAELEVHLASCAQCAEQVGRAQAGRGALRESRSLELPPHRREALLASLPAQRAPKTRRRLSLKGFVAIGTPVAAVAAVVVALVATGGFGPRQGRGGDEGAAAALSEESAPTTATTAPSSGGDEAAKDRATALFAAGPTDALAADLRAEGLDAEVVGTHVEVRNAKRADVRRALRGRRDGSVRVIIVH